MRIQDGADLRAEFGFAFDGADDARHLGKGLGVTPEGLLLVETRNLGEIEQRDEERPRQRVAAGSIDRRSGIAGGHRIAPARAIVAEVRFYDIAAFETARTQ